MDLVVTLSSPDAHAAEGAWAELRSLGPAVVPFLEQRYSRTRSWKGRVTLVFHSIRFARVSDAAVRMALAALNDRSYMVRYRACAALAYSLRTDVLEPLRGLLSHGDARTVADARAAIAAIERQNHHLFVDRVASGSSFWVVNEGDSPPGAV